MCFNKDKYCALHIYPFFLSLASIFFCSSVSSFLPLLLTLENTLFNPLPSFSIFSCFLSRCLD